VDEVHTLFQVDGRRSEGAVQIGRLEQQPTLSHLGIGGGEHLGE